MVAGKPGAARRLLSPGDEALDARQERPQQRVVGPAEVLGQLGVDGDQTTPGVGVGLAGGQGAVQPGVVDGWGATSEGPAVWAERKL
jgi:hypothetical protein